MGLICNLCFIKTILSFVFKYFFFFLLGNVSTINSHICLSIAQPATSSSMLASFYIVLETDVFQ